VVRSGSIHHHHSFIQLALSNSFTHSSIDPSIPSPQTPIARRHLHHPQCAARETLATRPPPEGSRTIRSLLFSSLFFFYVRWSTSPSPPFKHTHSSHPHAVDSFAGGDRLVLVLPPGQSRPPTLARGHRATPWLVHLSRRALEPASIVIMLWSSRVKKDDIRADQKWDFIVSRPPATSHRRGSR
jgi:hypothetical protein